jgi:carboxypeptidase C (cathepsin A)
MPPTRLLAASLALLLALPLHAQPAPDAPPRGEAERQAETARLPPAKTTRHTLDLGNRTLAFTATAGALTLESPDGEAEADVAFTAYVLDGGEGARDAGRPVTFAINGGPGAASAYLQLGALGPWFLPMDGERIVPSQPSALLPNPDTWLDFTDLVFIDPVGTGFSRLVDPDDALRDRYLSVEGDTEAIADFVLEWLTGNGRTGSPTYFVGESYGGFRGPLVAEALATDRGIGLDGLVLVSPVLDFGWWAQPEYAPLPMVTLLPSLAATRLEGADAFDPAALAEAEDYASGPFLVDLLAGEADEGAVARLVERVTALTGLDRATVAADHGRIDAGDFLRETRRGTGRRISLYDATVAATGGGPRGHDPVLDAMTAPLTSAMLAHYRDTLGWLPDRRYMLLNGPVSRAWDWGDGRGQPEAMTALAEVLALDPGLRVLVAHGYTDLVTPYFGSTLLLRQLPAESAARVEAATYRGGHMFYTRPDSRRALRTDAAALYGASEG